MSVDSLPSQSDFLYTTHHGELNFPALSSVLLLLERGPPFDEFQSKNERSREIEITYRFSVPLRNENSAREIFIGHGGVSVEVTSRCFRKTISLIYSAIFGRDALLASESKRQRAN